MSELDIFATAREINDLQERAEYIVQACGGDSQLQDKIEQLLQLSEKDDSFMEPSRANITSAASLATIKVGVQIGPYKLKEQIGEGGMGIVFVAEQKKPVQRRVALKIIKPGMDSRQVIARFEAERQALAMMDHPNIAKVLDAGTTEQGLPYFVMELVNGLPITQFCDQHQLSVQDRLDLYVSVCEGVQHAHQKGVIHRDLKPSNILLAMYDERPVPKVIDFGVAKATGHALGENSIYTQLGQIIGTLEYMSPEQAQRNQLDVDTRSDIYSLGVVLYELLTGHTPFDKERLQSAALDELLRIIGEEDPPKPSTKVSASQSLSAIAVKRKTDSAKLSALVRGELDWIVLKAMAKNRSRRYETANGLALDIKRHLSNEPVQACPPTAGYRFEKFWRRNKVRVTIAAVVAVLLIVGTTISIWLAIRATRAEHDANTFLAISKEQEQLAKQANTDLKKTIVELQQAKQKSDEEKKRAERSNEFIRRILLSPATRGVKATVGDLLFYMAERLDEDFEDDPKTKAVLLYTIFQANGFLNDPRLNPYAKKCLETSEIAYGVDSEIALFTASQVVKKLGMTKASEVEEFLVNLVTRSEAALGDNHIVSLLCKKKLTQFYSSAFTHGTPMMDRPEEAIKLLEEMDKVGQGPIKYGEHVKSRWEEDQITETRINLAVLYQKVERGQDAIDLLNQEIIRIRQGDRFDSYVQYAFKTLAEVYRKEGQTEDAIHLMESLVAELKDSGKNWMHSELELSRICRDAGQIQKAIEHVNNVYTTKIVKEFLNDPSKALESKNLNPGWFTNYVVDRLCIYKSALWKRDGNNDLLDQNIETYKKVLPVIEKVRAKSGLMYSTCSFNLATNLHYSNRFEQAIKLYPQSGDYFRKTNNLLVVFRMNTRLARCLIGLERIKEAIPFLTESIEWERKQFEGKTRYHVDTGRDGYGHLNKHMLGYANFKLGQTDPKLESWLINGAQFWYENLTLPDLPSEYAQKIRNEFHWSRVVAVECIGRVIEYLTEKGDRASIEQWVARLDEIKRLPNPNLKTPPDR